MDHIGAPGKTIIRAELGDQFVVTGLGVRPQVYSSRDLRVLVETPGSDGPKRVTKIVALHLLRTKRSVDSVPEPGHLLLMFGRKQPSNLAELLATGPVSSVVVDLLDTWTGTPVASWELTGLEAKLHPGRPVEFIGERLVFPAPSAGRVLATELSDWVFQNGAVAKPQDEDAELGGGNS